MQPSDQTLDDLLFMDVALMEGAVSGREAAAALLQHWDRRGRTANTLADVLQRTAGLTETQVQDLTKKAADLLNQAEGNAYAAITERGGLDQDLLASISRRAPQVSRHLATLRTPVRVPLRTAPKRRYLDPSVIGEGGMGIVYWAVDTELSRPVAMKVVRPPTDPDQPFITPPAPMQLRAPKSEEAATAYDELKARFLQEAWITGGLEHPGIAPVYEIGCTDEGVPYYTMRFIGGQRTLRDAIRETADKPLEDRLELLDVLLRICDAVGYAHDRGVMHRDLKPANIALGEHGEVVVLDWGLAKVRDAMAGDNVRWAKRVHTLREEHDLRTIASALGTPGYMPPETVNDGPAAFDERGDVYSIGAMLYEVLAGTLPFDPKDVRAYLAALANEDAPDVRTHAPDVPPGLAALCARALDRDPEARPTDATALRAELRAWQRQADRDQRVSGWSEEIPVLLSSAAAMEGAARTTALDRVQRLSDRILEQAPQHDQAKHWRAEAISLREAGIRAEEAAARRRTVRRVALASLVALLGTCAVFLVLLEGRRKEAAEQRDRAEAASKRAAEARDDAERTVEFMVGDLRGALEPLGKLDVLTSIGQHAQAHYVNRPVAEDTETGLARRLASQLQLGDALQLVGRLPDAMTAYGLARSWIESWEAVQGARAQSGLWRARLQARLALVEADQGYHQAARTSLAEAEAALAAQRDDEDSLTVLETELFLHRAHQRVASGEGDPERSLKAARAAATVAAKLADRRPDNERAQRLKLRTALTLHADRALTDSEGALKDIASIYAEIDAKYRAAPGNLAWRALRAGALRAWAWRSARYSEEQIQRADEAIAEFKALCALRPAHLGWRRGYASALLLRTYMNPAIERSLDTAEQAMRVAESLVAASPRDAQLLSLLITCRAQWLGARSDDQGSRIAEMIRQQVLDARRLRALDPKSRRLAMKLPWALGDYVIRRPDLPRDEQLKLLREALTCLEFIAEIYFPASDIRSMQVILLGDIAQRLDTGAAREALLDRAVQALEPHVAAPATRALAVRQVIDLAEAWRARDAMPHPMIERLLGQADTWLHDVADEERGPLAERVARVRTALGDASK